VQSVSAPLTNLSELFALKPRKPAVGFGTFNFQNRDCYGWRVYLTRGYRTCRHTVERAFIMCQSILRRVRNKVKARPYKLIQRCFTLIYAGIYSLSIARRRVLLMRVLPPSHSNKQSKNTIITKRLPDTDGRRREGESETGGDRESRTAKQEQRW